MFDACTCFGPGWIQDDKLQIGTGPHCTPSASLKITTQHRSAGHSAGSVKDGGGGGGNGDGNGGGGEGGGGEGNGGGGDGDGGDGDGDGGVGDCYGDGIDGGSAGGNGMDGGDGKHGLHRPQALLQTHRSDGPKDCCCSHI